MLSRQPDRLRLVFRASFVGLLAVGLTSFAPPAGVPRTGTSGLDGAFDSVLVQRMNLDTAIVAGGDLVPMKQAAINCEVEDLDAGPDGGGTAGTMILSIVPNGAIVKKGDDVCLLDSSRLIEMTRLQRIEVERSSRRISPG